MKLNTESGKNISKGISKASIQNVASPGPAKAAKSEAQGDDDDDYEEDDYEEDNAYEDDEDGFDDDEESTPQENAS